MNQQLKYKSILLYVVMCLVGILAAGCTPNVEKEIVGSWQDCLSHPDYKDDMLYGVGADFDRFLMFYANGSFTIQDGNKTVNGQYAFVSTKKTGNSYVTGDVMFTPDGAQTGDTLYYEFDSARSGNLALMEWYGDSKLFARDYYDLCRVDGSY